MVSDGNGITQEVSTNSKNPAAYPLTMVIYAMVPTSGLPTAKAEAIAQLAATSWPARPSRPGHRARHSCPPATCR